MNIQVDAEFAWVLTAHIWNPGQGRSRKYFGTRIARRTKLLHRFIYELKHGVIPFGMEIDHEDRDPSNNRSSNLRLLTRSFNQANRGPQVNSSSGFKGVHSYKAYGKWMAKIKKNGQSIFLGYFSDRRLAAKAVNSAYAIHFPGVALPNPIP